MSTRPSQPAGLTLTSLMRWMSQQQFDTVTMASPRYVRAAELRRVGRPASPGTVLRAGSHDRDETPR